MVWIYLGVGSSWGSIFASWFLLWKCERRPFFKATTAPTHTDGKDSKLGQVCVCVCCTCVAQHLHENDEWFYGLLDLNFIVCMHGGSHGSHRCLPLPPRAPLLVWPAHCEWKILCLHKKLDFCISYGNEKTSTWFVFHWFTPSTPSLLSPTLSLEFSSFFLWASECAGQKKTVFGNSLGKLFEFPSFIFGLLLSPHWVFRFFGFVHLLFGLLWFPNPLPGGEVWDIYSACLMLIRFGSWISPGLQSDCRWEHGGNGNEAYF